jgi:hypothetical protein
MVFNVQVEKSAFETLCKTLKSDTEIKIISSLDFIAVLSIQTSKKHMEELMKENPGILSVEKDGEVFALDK